MGKSLSITVYPTSHGAEYLAVSDAMRQILDTVEALGRAEAAETGRKKIIWRLTEAHTNSPPLTVTLQAFSVEPTISVALEASRLMATFEEGVRELMGGRKRDWIDKEVAAPLKRIFERNLNGIGRTVISIDDEEFLDVVPEGARKAMLALQQAEIEDESAVVDYAREEYGSVELEIQGVVRWHDRPSLNVIERLSQEKVICVLDDDLAEQIGPAHQWREVWETRRIFATGTLHFDRENHLKRIDALNIEEMPWTDVPLGAFRSIDILQGKSVSDHIEAIRKENGA